MANKEHVRRLLDESIKAWNAWRKRERNARPDLSNADLSNADLSNADLSGTDLHDADLHDADLHDADLHDADLHDADLHGADLCGADLCGANLSGTDFSDANLSNADLRNADLSGTDFSDANLSDADLRSTDLSGTDLRDKDLGGANLSGANLSDKDLGGANLSDADLRNANLRNADLRGTDLRGANLSRADLSGTDFSDTGLLSGANLSDADLRSTDFSNADLSNVDLSRAYINGDTQFDGVTVNGNTKGLGPWVFNPEKYILREIEFLPEYHQAGVSIMNYFATVLREKYPAIPATVQITQEDLIVRMTIETEGGHREIVERTLEEYGLVVSGQRQPAELFDNPVAIMRLENKLTMVEAELQQERRAYALLEGQKEMSNRLLRWAEKNVDQQNEHIKHLKTEVSELRRILGKSLAGTQEVTLMSQKTTHLLATVAVDHSQALATLFSRHMERASDNEILRQAISRIETLAERVLAAPDQDSLSGGDKVALTQAAMDIQTEDGAYWTAFKAELITFFSGVVSGVGGNIATEILKLLSVL